MNEKSDVDIIKEGLNELLSKEKPNLPYYMDDTFKTCLALGLLFDGLKLGEIANNVVFQLSRLSQMFDTKIDFNKEEIKGIVQHFVEIIKKKLTKIGDDAKPTTTTEEGKRPNKDK
jgi:hypothetical protein